MSYGNKATKTELHITQVLLIGTDGRLVDQM